MPSDRHLSVKTLALFRQHHFRHNLRDHQHTHVQTRTHSDSFNVLPQLEQAFAAYLKDTSKLEELEGALKTATDAGCTDTTVYGKVAAVLQAIKTVTM